MEKIKIIVVDDHQIMRDGIRAMLIGNTDIQIIGEASKGEQLNDLLRKEVPDIVILDISLPGISGIEVAKEISRSYPLVRIIMLSANTDESAITASFRAGASGFLPKDTSREEFIKAILTVHQGNEYFGSGITQTLFSSYIKKIKKGESHTHDKHPGLTGREIEIIRLFSDGLSYKEIANKLYISTRTVETHKNNILEKLNLNSIVDLVKYAIKNKLIEI